MKKQLIILIVCLVVAGALGAALWFLLGYEPQGEDTGSSVPSQTVTILEKTEYDLDTLEVKNETGTYTVKNQGDSKYTILGLEDAPLVSSMLKSAANAGVSLTANSVVAEGAEDLAPFGLQSPRATITAKYTDGSAFTFLLGSDAPGGNGIYGKEPDKDTVYLMSSYNFNNILKDKLEYIDTAILSVQPEDPNATQILPRAITLGGSCRSEEIVIKQSDQTDEQKKAFNLTMFEMVEPKSRAIDSDKGTEMLAGMLSVSANAAVAYKPDDGALAAYGLREPYSTARITWVEEEGGEEQTASLRLSQKDSEGNIYLYKDGVPVVYQLAASSLPWYDVQYHQLIASLQLLPYIDDVKTMTVMIGGETRAFELEGEDDALLVKCGGDNINVEEFRSFYQNIIGLPSQEYTEDTPPAEDTALLRVTFSYRDGAPADTMALLPGPTRKVFLSINGEAEFYTKESYIDIIRQNLQNLLEGKEVAPLY